MPKIRVRGGRLLRQVVIAVFAGSVHDSKQFRQLWQRTRYAAYAGVLLVLSAIAVVILGPGQTVTWTLVFSATAAALSSLLLLRSVLRARGAVATMMERQDLLSRIAGTTRDVIYIYDLLNRRHVYLNHSVGQVLGYSPAEVLEMGKDALPALIYPDDLPAVVHSHHRLSGLGDGDLQHSEFRVKHADGSVRWLHARELVFKRDRLGRPLQVLGTASDITDRKEAERQIEQQKKELQAANQQLEALASTDHLTGLANRRPFFERLDLELTRSRRTGLPLSLIVMDVDHFKGYNDTFGHPEGDQVLRTIARLLLEQLRETDLVARIGGEEFAVILPMTDMAEAEQTAERLRVAIEGHGWKLRSVTSSFGLTTVLAGASTPEEALKVADDALYRAKAQGRNRIESMAMFARVGEPSATAAS